MTFQLSSKEKHWSNFAIYSYRKKYVHKHEFNQHTFFGKKHFYEKMSLKNPKTVRKQWENLQSRIAWASILKSTNFSYSLAL